jgi:hypothetical protein
MAFCIEVQNVSHICKNQFSFKIVIFTNKKNYILQNKMLGGLVSLNREQICLN